MALTDTAIRNAKAREKPYKMGDSGGLFLLVQPSGGKLWRVKFRVEGREKKLAIGTYPEVSISEARKRRDAARELLAMGKDPAREHQRQKARAKVEAVNTFELIATEYFEKRRRDGDRPWADATHNKNKFLLEQLKPDLGNIPVHEIEPADVLAALRKIEAKGNLETARRALQMTGSVMRYAVATARLRSDPTRDLRGALTAPRVKNHAAILEPSKLGELLRAIDGYGGHIHSKLALSLAPHVFVRPGELRQAQWEEIDIDRAVWSISGAKTKMRKAHHVPLSRQALEIIQTARALTSRTEGYVFPSLNSSARPMSENTLNSALRRLGYSKDEMTSHGFRSTASTLLNESGLWRPDVIERALAHGDSDKVRGTYNHSPYWPERVEMAQWWSDYLDQLRSGADAVELMEQSA